MILQLNMKKLGKDINIGDIVYTAPSNKIFLILYYSSSFVDVYSLADNERFPSALRNAFEDSICKVIKRKNNERH